MTENNFGKNSGSGFSGSPETGSGSMSGGSMTGTTAPVELCPHCGQTTSKGGVEEMLAKLKTQFQNVDIDEYMNAARDYLKTGSSKATAYAKENPSKIAAGAAAIALGAGLLYAAMHRGEKGSSIEITRDEREPFTGTKSNL